LRTLEWEPEKWEETGSRTEIEGTIPNGWRLATKKETKAAVDLGVNFGASTLVHSGSLVTTVDNSYYTKAWRANSEPYSHPSLCTASNGPNAGSLLKMSFGSKAFLLIMVDEDL